MPDLRFVCQNFEICQNWVNGFLTKEFPIKYGVLQGSVLGLTLFLLFIDDLLGQLHTSNLGIPMKSFFLSVLAFADDVTLIALKTEKFQRLLNICDSWAKRNGMIFGLDKCFVLVFNSKSKKPEDLPSFYLKGPDHKQYRIASHYPEKSEELYLGFNTSDLITGTKIDDISVHLHSLIPNFRNKPTQSSLNEFVPKFNRTRHGTHQLCPDKSILTPTISMRIYKTLQRSTLLYAIEFCDWDVDQIRKIECLQASALRTHLDSDLQCPQPILRLVAGVEPFEARRDFHV